MSTWDELRAEAEKQPGRVIENTETQQRAYRAPVSERSSWGHGSRTRDDYEEDPATTAARNNPNPAEDPGAQPVAIYEHPDGKRVTVLDDGTYECTKAGKRATTSATPEKLAAGYGRWKRVDS